MFLQRISQPDITFIVCRLSQYNSDLAIWHWAAVIRVFRYLKGTLDYSIQYRGYGQLLGGLCGFADSDYARDPEDRLSTYRYVFLL